MPYTLKQNQEVMQLVVAGGRLEPPIGVPDEVKINLLFNLLFKFRYTIKCSTVGIRIRKNDLTLANLLISLLIWQR